MVEMNEWGCELYGSAGNLLTFVSFCNKNTGMRVICSAGYSPENMVTSIKNPTDKLLLVSVFHNRLSSGVEGLLYSSYLMHL